VLSKKGNTSALDLPIESVSLSLRDLIGYFQPPDEHLEHEEKQNRLRHLKNRQNLFQEEVGGELGGLWEIQTFADTLFFFNVLQKIDGQCVCMHSVICGYKGMNEPSWF
jgi:hypothetical protein